MRRFVACVLAYLCFCGQVESSEHFLSYIIPCYNCENWIEETINSIYLQNDLQCPFEIVCTDDGSTDSTHSILDRLASAFPEIKVYRHLRNQGGSLTRNTCVYHSRGDLIFCLDSDNVLCPDSIQGLIERMDETSADVVSFGGMRYFKCDFVPLSTVQYATADGYYDLEALLANENTPPWSGNYLYTRTSFDNAGGYPPRLTTDTFSFGLRQVLTGSKMTYLPGTYYWHRVDVGGYYTRESTTNRIGIDFFDTILSIRPLLEDSCLKHIEEQREKAINGWSYIDQISMLMNQQIRVK